MDNDNRKQKLEQRIATADGQERLRLLSELARLAGHRGANTRPRGEESEKR